MERKEWKKLFSYATYPAVFPVIHVQSAGQAIANITRVRDQAIAGVFLINHEFGYEKLVDILKVVRQNFPSLWIGVNFLGITGDVAFPVLSQLEREGCHIDGYWADDACIDERKPYMQIKADHIAEIRENCGWSGLYIAGVAFKKQREIQPQYHNLVAQIGTHFMDVVCTSGVKTGSAADIDKICEFRSGCGDKVLVLASGVTPQNVLDYVPYVDCILVATGISTDFHNVNSVLLDELLIKIKSAESDVKLMRPPSWYLSLNAPNTRGPSWAWLDPSAIYADADALADLIQDMTSPFPAGSYDVVAGIDGTGFITGCAIAHKFNKAFVVVRKKGKLCVETELCEYTDYSGSIKGLEIRKDNPFKAGSRVLIVDQHMETGATLTAALTLVERAGGVVAGITVIGMERSSPEVYEDLNSRYKCHHVIPEQIHHLYDSHEFLAAKHVHLLLN